MRIISLALILFCTACTHSSILPDSPALADESFRNTRPLGPANTATFQPASMQIEQALPPQSIPLSNGDKIRITIPAGEEFSGIFAVDLDGAVHLPYLEPIIARGKTPEQLAEALRQVLVMKQWFNEDFLQITISPMQWAPSNIVITGSVYNPGNIMINERKYEEKLNDTVSLSGDFAQKRHLSAALKAAGGLKPDADLRNIRLERNGRHYILDMSGLVTGKPVIDPPLTSGDRVTVASVGYMQTELLRPSRITPPGFRVYLSNLTIPADSNNKASNNKFASSLPPGTRLLKGSMSANCVGGTVSVNANRHVILVGKDPTTNAQRVLQRSLKELLEQPNSDAVNPYLLPGDSIACYDSRMTNARDIARAIGDFLRPFVILSGAAL